MKINKNVAGVNVDYEENFWTGKSSLAFNNIPLVKVSRKTFIYSQNNLKRTVNLKGNFISGVKMQIDGYNEDYSLLEYSWYEKILIFIPILGFVLGIFCGAIFAAVAAVCSCTLMVINAKMMQSNMPAIFKILLSLSLFIIITVAWFFLYLEFVDAFFPVMVD